MSHRHRMSTTSEPHPFRGPAHRPQRPNPAAHGGYAEVHRCRCGAQKVVNRNGDHAEHGAWYSVRDVDILEVFGPHPAAVLAAAEAVHARPVGRPRVADADRQRHMLTVRLSDTELAILNRLHEHYSGRSRSWVVRRLIVRGALRLLDDTA